MAQHHDALSDAKACAEAYICLKHGKRPDRSLITKEEPIDMFAGHEKLTGSVLKPNLNIENQNNPFYSKKVVFTGVYPINYKGRSC